jgi:hypothetical protein
VGGGGTNQIKTVRKTHVRTANCRFVTHGSNRDKVRDAELLRGIQKDEDDETDEAGEENGEYGFRGPRMGDFKPLIFEEMPSSFSATTSR